MSQISKSLYKKLQKQYSRRINLDLKRIKKVLQKVDMIPKSKFFINLFITETNIDFL